MDVDSQLITSTPIPVDTIVKVNLEGNTKVCVVTKEYLKGNGRQGCQVRPLNNSLHSTVNGAGVKLILLDPADIPDTSEDVDTEVIQTFLSEEYLQHCRTAQLTTQSPKKVE